jgi:hypothetical protein
VTKAPAHRLSLLLILFTLRARVQPMLDGDKGISSSPRENSGIGLKWRSPLMCLELPKRRNDEDRRRHRGFDVRRGNRDDD